MLLFLFFPHLLFLFVLFNEALSFPLIIIYVESLQRLSPQRERDHMQTAHERSALFTLFVSIPGCSYKDVTRSYTFIHKCLCMLTGRRGTVSVGGETSTLLCVSVWGMGSRLSLRLLSVK